MEHHYVHHILRMPADQWPDPVNRAFKHLNPSIYIPMQGRANWGAGALRTGTAPPIRKINVPTLVIGAR